GLFTVILSGVCIVAGGGAAAVTTGSHHRQAIYRSGFRDRLTSSGTPQVLLDKLDAGKLLSPTDRSQMTDEQKRLARELDLAIEEGEQTGALIGRSSATIGACYIPSAVLFVLIGLVFTRKRRVLACRQCGASIDRA
ncbi:MAG TPA: hypothetical protein DCY13_18895, partial [Verrucomicrobiales bacterium]|nr:hypothetical protein [Verrucomicrobiales bacterium]